MLLSYFGHTSVGNCAKVVLTRDPGGRSLMTGSVAAMLTVVALYSLWVFSVGAAVPAARLRSEPGTALVPLAEEAGRAASVVGFIFVFLAVGMGTVHLSLGSTTSWPSGSSTGAQWPGCSGSASSARSSCSPSC